MIFENTRDYIFALYNHRYLRLMLQVIRSVCGAPTYNRGCLVETLPPASVNPSQVRSLRVPGVAQSCPPPTRMRTTYRTYLRVRSSVLASAVPVPTVPPRRRPISPYSPYLRVIVSVFIPCLSSPPPLVAHRQPWGWEKSPTCWRRYSFSSGPQRLPSSCHLGAVSTPTPTPHQERLAMRSPRQPHCFLAGSERRSRNPRRRR